MKHIENGVQAYEAPALETLDICVEQGFAGSSLTITEQGDIIIIFHRFDIIV